MNRSAVRSRISVLAAFTALATPGLAPVPAAAQETRFPGVELGMVYESYTPSLGIKPFTGRLGGADVQSVALQVQAIVGRDLGYSDRFQMMDSIPPSLTGQGIDYSLWDRLGATWLLSGAVEPSGAGYTLELQVHDVPYGQVRHRGSFSLPQPSDEGFRMAAHRVSDQIVEWIFDEPGMAASRIAFSMRTPSGMKELYLIDSDGENLERVTDHDAISFTPAWSPDGTKLVYATDHVQPWEFYEMDVATGEERKLDIVRSGTIMTPAYHPDGDRIAFGVRTGQGRGGLYTYDVRRNCCLENLMEGPRDDLSPTFSPDGRSMAFNSNRLGDAVPQIYVVPTGGGQPELVSPYAYGQQGYYNSPDWSPRGDNVAFHGRIGRNGLYQILVARVQDRGRRILQLTSSGNNEDPSWAPDGRHLVYKGEQRWGKGLFVIDTATGKVRELLRGVEVTTPDWSPSLAEETPR